MTSDFDRAICDDIITELGSVTSVGQLRRVQHAVLDRIQHTSVLPKKTPPHSQGLKPRHGDRVELNNLVVPYYLRGCRGTVMSNDAQAKLRPRARAGVTIWILLDDVHKARNRAGSAIRVPIDALRLV